jgi:hypothetical protein
MMPLPLPYPAPQPAPETPAIVRVYSRADVLWNRPVFKAPPLNVEIPVSDISELAFGIRKPDAIARIG